MHQHEAWLLSLVVELPLLVVMLYPYEVKRVVWAGLVATSLTHPVAWWAAGLLAPAEYTQGVLVIEIVVWATESVLFRFMLPTQWAAAAACACLANTASMTVGWFV